MSSDRGLAIRSIDDVERIAKMALASGFTACRRMEEAAMIIMTGHELGLSPMQSLRGIYIVSGKPVLSADLMVAVVRRSGLCSSWRVVVSTPEQCTIITIRQGETEPSSRTWTLADAKRAGITGKGTWSAYPATMLRHRCASDLAREVYPDVLMGLYDPEELSAESAPEPTSHPAIASPEIFAQLGIEARTVTAPREPIDALVVDLATQAARCKSVAGLASLWVAAKADVAALDDRSLQERAWATIKVRARDLGIPIEVLRAEIARQMQPPPPPPPTGTDGPSGPSSASESDDAPAPAPAPVAAPAAPLASVARVSDADPDAWRLTREGIDAHVSAIRVYPRLGNSARKHLRHMRDELTLHAIHAYARRMAEIQPSIEWEDAIERVETWMREGPIATRTQRAA